MPPCGLAPQEAQIASYLLHLPPPSHPAVAAPPDEKGGIGLITSLASIIFISRQTSWQGDPPVYCFGG